MGRFTLKDLGQRISLRGALDYLVRHGWRVSAQENRLVCEGPSDDDGRPILRLMPPSESYADYLDRLEDLIATLSALEERPAMEVAAEMARSGETTTAGALADEIIEAFTRRGVELAPGKDLGGAIDELRPLLEGVGQAPIGSPGIALSDAAMLAARLTRLLAGGDAAKQLLGRVSELALAAGGLTLRLSPPEVDELFAIARGDDPSSPDRLLDWLDARTKGQDSGRGATAKRPTDKAH